MIYESEARGEARITHYLPTLPALRYLSCCTMAGWHRCTDIYRQKYDNGGDDLFLIFTLAGSGRICAGGREHILGKDSLILIPPHTPMEYATDRTAGSWEFYWLDLTGEQVCAMADRLWEDMRHYLPSLPEGGIFFRSLLEEQLSEPDRSAMIGRLFDKIIAAAIFGGSEEKSTADRILAYIAAHYREPISLRELSGQFYLSQNQIIRILRGRTGYAPHEYLMRYRLTKACELLQATSDPIGEIGRRVGYDNSSHFAARFRALYGISPGEYRAYFSR